MPLSDQQKLDKNLNILPEERLINMSDRLYRFKTINKKDYRKLNNYYSYVISHNAKFINQTIERKRKLVLKRFQRMWGHITTDFDLTKNDGYQFNSNPKAFTKFYKKIFKKCIASYKHFIQEANEIQNQETPIIDNHNLTSSFNNNTAVISINNQSIQLPHGKNAHDFCYIAYESSVGELINWDEISERINSLAIKDKIKAKRQVYDTMKSINKLVTKLTNNKELFEMKNKVIKRLF